MKNKFRSITYILLVSLICFVPRGFTQTPARKGPAPTEEIQKALKVVTSNLDSLKAHRTYIYAMGLSNPQLTAQYNIWMEKYPEKVTIPLSIGTAYYNAEMPQAKEYLLKAAELAPQNARIWSMLSADADMRGQKDLSIEYQKKAVNADPSDAGYAFNYLLTFRNSNPGIYKQQALEFIKHFPNTEQAASALYWLGEDATNQTEKVKYFEDLRKLFPPQKFQWSASGMIPLADIYLQTDPEKALSLINEMGEGKTWKIRKQVAEALIQVNQLTQSRNYTVALTQLNQVKLPQFSYINDFITLKKAALLNEAGDPKSAYDTLTVKFAKLPTDQLEDALVYYGGIIGKNKAQVITDVQAVRNGTATPAYPFNLGLYTSTGKLNLNDLKGKVVLLTFWFPACSPCKAEFPHFQAVINQFKNDAVAYVGINVFPEQDSFVIPFIKNTKFSFIPLRGDSQFARKFYGVNSEPENFLIDKNGKIVFKDFSINGNNHRTLELMINSLL